VKITPQLKATIVNEIRYAVDKMKKSERISDKIYYFSAVYAIADRSFNFEFDSELVFIHQVVRQAFDTINAKTNLATQIGPSLGTSIPQNLFPKLQETLASLADKIEKNEETYVILEEIANIGFSTTGNGSYLHGKGLLKI
jgi:hypothetical protein